MNFKYKTKNDNNDEIKELHFKLPKALMYENKYKKLSANAKLLYAMLSDRSNLSMKNGWYDKYDRAFIVCSIEEIEIFLDCARGSAIKYLKELVSFNLVKKAKACEIEFKQIKNNTLDIESLQNSNANILYIGYVDTSDKTLKNHLETHFENLKQLKSKRKLEEKERRKRREQKKALIKNCTMSWLKNYPMLENAIFKNKKVVDPSNFNIDSSFDIGMVQDLAENKTDLKNTELVVVVNKESYRKIPNRELTTFEKIQLNQNLTTNEKIKEIDNIKNINLKEVALLEKFINASILVSDAQLNMIKGFEFKVANEALDTTIAQGGETFSYFKKVYNSKEEEDINNMIDDLMPLNAVNKANLNKSNWQEDNSRENEIINEKENNEERKLINNNFYKEFYDRAVANDWKISSITYNMAKSYAQKNNLFCPKEENMNFAF